MANKHLKPIHNYISQGWFWYEDPKGISIYRWSNNVGNETDNLIIPWKGIRAALKRKDKKS